MAKALPNPEIDPGSDDLTTRERLTEALRRTQENLDALAKLFPVGPQDSQRAPHVAALSTVAQSIPHATWTALTYDSAEYEVAGELWSSGATLTAPRAGLYVAGGSVRLNAPGAEAFLAVANPGISRCYALASHRMNGGSNFPHMAVSTCLRLDAGQGVVIAAFQATGGAVNTFVDSFFETRGHLTFLSA